MMKIDTRFPAPNRECRERPNPSCDGEPDGRSFHSRFGAGGGAAHKCRSIAIRIFRATTNEESVNAGYNRSLTVAAPFRSIFKATANAESGHLTGCHLTGARDRFFHSRFCAKEEGARAMGAVPN
jgi:hypothetical protein